MCLCMYIHRCTLYMYLYRGCSIITLLLSTYFHCSLFTFSSLHPAISAFVFVWTSYIQFDLVLSIVSLPVTLVHSLATPYPDQKSINENHPSRFWLNKSVFGQSLIENRFDKVVKIHFVPQWSLFKKLTSRIRKCRLMGSRFWRIPLQMVFKLPLHLIGQPIRTFNFSNLKTSLSLYKFWLICRLGTRKESRNHFFKKCQSQFKIFHETNSVIVM